MKLTGFSYLSTRNATDVGFYALLFILLLNIEVSVLLLIPVSGEREIYSTRHYRGETGDYFSSSRALLIVITIAPMTGS